LATVPHPIVVVLSLSLNLIEIASVVLKRIE
jgi:hypothetical protein